MDEPLQFAEVLRYLAEHRNYCSIINVDSKKEVTIEGHGPSVWGVYHTVSWSLEGEDSDSAGSGLVEQHLRELEQLGLSLETRTLVLQFGPKKGQAVHILRVEGSFGSPQEAAGAAFGLFHALYDLPANEWLWVTDGEPDSRDESVKPSVWPPTNA